ncbi:MAG: hypothetical protein Q8L87_10305 [Anaerolineales bacterium]|jgi:hypothetical protein|nr:hypothetical protein [Anaerolineales bacterium]
MRIDQCGNSVLEGNFQGEFSIWLGLPAEFANYAAKRIISIIWGELPDPKGFSVRLGTLLAKYAVRQDNLASEGNL